MTSQPPDSPARTPDGALATILLVDDADDVRVTTKWFLTNFGYAVDAVCNAEEALALFDPEVHALVLTDNRMPGMSGLAMVRVIKQRSPRTRVVMYTGDPPGNHALLDAVIRRPAHLLEVKETIDCLLT